MSKTDNPNKTPQINEVIERQNRTPIEAMEGLANKVMEMGKKIFELRKELPVDSPESNALKDVESKTLTAFTRLDEIKNDFKRMEFTSSNKREIKEKIAGNLINVKQVLKDISSGLQKYKEKSGPNPILDDLARIFNALVRGLPRVKHSNKKPVQEIGEVQKSQEPQEKISPKEYILQISSSPRTQKNLGIFLDGYHGFRLEDPVGEPENFRFINEKTGDSVDIPAKYFDAKLGKSDILDLINAKIISNMSQSEPKIQTQSQDTDTEPVEEGEVYSAADEFLGAQTSIPEMFVPNTEDNTDTQAEVEATIDDLGGKGGAVVGSESINSGEIASQNASQEKEIEKGTLTYEELEKILSSENQPSEFSAKLHYEIWQVLNKQSGNYIDKKNNNNAYKIELSKGSGLLITRVQDGKILTFTPAQAETWKPRSISATIEKFSDKFEKELSAQDLEVNINADDSGVLS